MPVSAGNPVTVEGAELGRYLFYDPVLSGDSTFACASCHRQESAFSDAPNKFTKGVAGHLASRNALPLFNLAWYPAFFWDGRAKSIEEQVTHPLTDKSEMNSDWKKIIKRIRNSKFYVKKFRAAFGNVPVDSLLIAKAIAQFERTLISHDAKYDRVLRKADRFTPEELEGFEIVNDMTRGNCVQCHTTDADALGTIREFSNIGLDSVALENEFRDKGLGNFTKNKKDNGKFKIPSLRNILLTAPYMHDGRFKTIEEVIDFYSDGVKHGLNVDPRMDFSTPRGGKFDEYEKRKIIAFLKTMTDSVFIRNPEFGNPFRK